MTRPASLVEVVRSAVADFGTVGAEHALVGGLAVGVHVLPRATRDADFAIAVANDAESERIVRDLVARGYGLVLALEETNQGRLSTVRLASRVDGRTLVDLLFASSGIEAEVVAAAERVEISFGVEANVARRGHLVALKLLARRDARPQDDQDLVALLDDITESELMLARESASLIMARGFHRSKDLLAELNAALERAKRLASPS
jgi:predicted nucleotidyltransferase